MARVLSVRAVQRGGKVAVRMGLFRYVAAAMLLFALPFSPSQAADQYINVSNGAQIHRIFVPLSRSMTLQLSEDLGDMVVGNSNIADAQPMTDRTLYVIGKGFGVTTINLFSTDRRSLGVIEIEVGSDTGDISRAIRQLAPDARVRVTTVNGRIHLSGEVSDAVTMAKILDLVSQYGDDRVVNAIRLKNGQQINLQVRILEARRDTGREFGIDYRFGPVAVNTSGEIIGTSGTPGGKTAGATGRPFQGGNIGLITNGAPGSTVDGTAQTFGTLIANIIDGGLTGFNVDVIINALEAKGLVRTLAEPNLTALSGEKARFLAGGEFPVRSLDESGNAIVSYKPFGVRLDFTSLVLDDGKIHIKLTPEVSEVSGFTPAGDPILNSRNLETTVQLRSGQSFAVAGLLQQSNRKQQNQLPWIGQIPILGALFRSSSYIKGETELVVIVTPQIVEPVAPGDHIATPLDRTRPANDSEFFLEGKLEVTKDMIRRFELGEGVEGPHGHIIDLDKDDLVYVKK